MFYRYVCELSNFDVTYLVPGEGQEVIVVFLFEKSVNGRIQLMDEALKIIQR